MADLLTAAGSEPVLIGDGCTTTAGELRDSAARIAAALPPASPGLAVAFAFDGDRASFAAALLATWLRGHAAALPASPRRRHVGPLLRHPNVCVLVHDTGAGTGIDVPRLLASRGDSPPAQPALPLHGPLLVPPHERPWPAAELAARIEKAANELALPPGVCVWSTFRPACPHSLVDGLLAPLACGARITSGSPTAERLEALSTHTLVAPASVLRRFARGRLPRGLAQVVAADDTIDAGTSQRFAAASVKCWHRAAYATDDLERRQRTIESLLFAEELVMDAAVAVVRTGDGQHAFCAVSAPATLRAALYERLPEGIGATFVFVDELPRDPDGALSREALLRLFNRLPDGEAPSPRLLFDQQGGSGAHTFHTHVPRAFFGFAGHFAEYPVLSGAVQLHELVLPCARRVFGAFEIAGFQDLKFLSRIAPGDDVDVIVRRGSTTAVCDFEIRRGDARCTTGRLLLRAAAENV